MVDDYRGLNPARYIGDENNPRTGNPEKNQAGFNGMIEGIISLLKKINQWMTQGTFFWETPGARKQALKMVKCHDMATIDDDNEDDDENHYCDYNTLW